MLNQQTHKKENHIWLPISIGIFVVAFGLSALGGLSIAPSVGYGQDNALPADVIENKRNANAQIQGQKDYNAGYNEGYVRAREEEQKRMDKAEANQNSGCCGGGQQSGG